MTGGMVEGTRRRGRPRRAWCDDIKEWTKSITRVSCCNRQRIAQLGGLWSAVPPMHQRRRRRGVLR